MSKTKAELEKEFNVKNGIIQNFGKFEGEPLSTPFYYDIMMNGGGEFIDIEPSDRVQFPNIPDDKAIAYVTEDDQGFVTIEFLNADEAEDSEGSTILFGFFEQDLDDDEQDDEQNKEEG